MIFEIKLVYINNIYFVIYIMIRISTIDIKVNKHHIESILEYMNSDQLNTIHLHITSDEPNNINCEDWFANLYNCSDYDLPR